MNQLRKLLGVLAVTLLVAIPLHAAPKDKNVTAYLFGFAASFNDSIVYITDIQEVATAKYPFNISRAGVASGQKRILIPAAQLSDRATPWHPPHRGDLLCTQQKKG